MDATSIATRTVLPAARADSARWFYVAMAGIGVLIAFGGFTPTYWSRVAAGSFDGAPVLHIHGALFFAWTLFFLAQTWLVAAGRTPDHRQWGLAGISLATAMLCAGLLAVLQMIASARALGVAEAGLRFAIVPLSALALFAGFFALAIANVKRSEVHKRLMLMTMIPLMQPAIGRVFLTLFAPPGAVGPPPVFVALPPGLLADLLIVAAMVFDWRTRGRPHPVYWICGALLVASQVLAVPLSATPGWMVLARAFASLAG
jgi:hypothetical protein